MPYQRRGDFHGLVESVRSDFRYRHEFKWTNIRPGDVPAYTELIDRFFRTNWLAFHCIVCPTKVVRHDLHRNREEMLQKHFTMLLTNKMRWFRSLHPDREHTFRVWVDPLPNSYAKANEVVEKIANAVLKKVFRDVRPVDGVTVVDSKDTPSVQLCDVLLGAVLAAWQGDAEAAYKLAVQTEISKRLGWPNLRWDTRHTERKFNIWMFHDPTRDARTARTREVDLLYPLPPLASRR